jgi:hypothetical protein
MAVDWADIGNLVLGVSGVVAVYVATTGHSAEAVLIGSLGVVVKAFCSALDNYKYKKAQAA